MKMSTYFLFICFLLARSCPITLLMCLVLLTRGEYECSKPNWAEKAEEIILTGSHYTNKHVQNNDIKLKDDFGFRAILCTGKSLRTSIWPRYKPSFSCRSGHGWDMTGLT